MQGLMVVTVARVGQYIAVLESIVRSAAAPDMSYTPVLSCYTIAMMIVEAQSAMLAVARTACSRLGPVGMREAQSTAVRSNEMKLRNDEKDVHDSG